MPNTWTINFGKHGKTQHKIYQPNSLNTKKNYREDTLLARPRK